MKGRKSCLKDSSDLQPLSPIRKANLIQESRPIVENHCLNLILDKSHSMNEGYILILLNDIFA